MSLKFAVILGSVRTERVGMALAKHCVSELEARGAEVMLADPKELDFPMIDYRYHELEKQGALSGKQKEFGEFIRACDGIVFVSAEYNHGIPAALKNIIDVVGSEFKWKIAGIASYSAGIYGGARAATQLRVSLGALMPTQPSMMNVPELTKNIDESGKPLSDTIARTSKGFHDSLIWWADAIAQKKKGGLPG